MFFLLIYNCLFQTLQKFGLFFRKLFNFLELPFNHSNYSNYKLYCEWIKKIFLFLFFDF